MSELKGPWTHELERVDGVRCVAFDAVGTLIFPDPPAAEVYARVGRRYGTRRSTVEIAERFTAAFRQYEADDLTQTGSPMLTTDEGRERRRWESIVGTVLDDVRDPKPCFKELFHHFAQPSAWRCYDDVGETLSNLSGSGYRLAIASNFDARLNAVCDGLPELRSIELRVISSLVGYRKPSPHFFEALARNSGCRPHEILVVGDDYRNDVVGGGQAGLLAVELCRDSSPQSSCSISTLRELTG